MKCKLVDVFSAEKLSGNGLTIFYDYDSLTSDRMLALTQEMRQFESIFLTRRRNKDTFRARVFTTEEELDFAGHPLLGLAAHLHEEYGSAESHEWVIELNKQNVVLETKKTGTYYKATMDQGVPEYLKEIDRFDVDEIRVALNLKKENMSDYPLEVISTGLPYLIVPIVSGIENAKIVIDDFEELLSRHQAKFVYVLDINNIEGRTWDNQGSIEDIATGSAAGPSGAFLYNHNLVQGNCSFEILQGRLVSRPSRIEVLIKVEKNKISKVYVSGHVCKIADIDFV